MNNLTFWLSVKNIISNGFTPEGIDLLERYAELFSTGRLLFKRFAPQEQYGCATGGTTHVIATILAGTETPSNRITEELPNFKKEFEHGAYQTEIIEKWAKASGVWINNTDIFLKNSFGDFISEGGEAKVYDNGASLVKSIGLDYFIQPVHALDRISLHNTYFPETRLTVIGFGKDSDQQFKIIVEQPFIEGFPLSEEEIENFITSIGFQLRNRRNWTYTTPYIYLSDLHDENIIKSKLGNYYVIDCDIRLNTPDLKLDGIRKFTNEIEYMD
ncbi:MAG: hypothetical protein K2O49_01730 [Muribaculaceae bacterium]|nr:hypothetical protein [Muribaculaceae bacterium]